MRWGYFSRRVSQKAAELVAITHDEGREAIMFLGDNWIGTEPYGPYFPAINLDAVVGSVGSAATCRMISDIPGVRYTEGRFLPYFFPDVFNPEGDPIGEAVVSWAQARRAIVRKPGCGRPQLLGRVADLANLHGRARTVVQADLQLRRSYRVSGWTSS